MQLIYIGPHEAVDVPTDLYGDYIAERNGAPVDFPDDIAQGLLEQGQDSTDDDPTHQPQWIKATPKQTAAAQKKTDDPAAADGADD